MKATEHRGITLRQLKDLVAFIDGHADANGFLPGWLQTYYRNKDKDGKWDGTYSKEVRCHKDTINLYDVVAYVVEPATEAQKCSYVELVAPQGTTVQTPRWFVSHWWGEPVKDFVKAVEKHSKVRFPTGERNEVDCDRNTADEDVSYWVCAYANNQHDLGSDIPADPRESAFFKAMQLCDGVLVVLDASATVFTRSWCAQRAGRVEPRLPSG